MLAVCILNCIERVRGCALGQSLGVSNIVEYPQGGMLIINISASTIDLIL